MKEKEFLIEINKKVNENGELTQSIIYELLNEEESLEVDTKLNIFTRLFKRNKKVKSAKQIIEDNFELILSKTNDHQLFVVLDLMMSNSETLGVVKSNFSKILRRFTIVPDVIDKEYDDAEIRKTARARFFCTFRNMKDGDTTLTENIDMIIQDGIGLDDAQYLKGLSDEIDEKINNQLNATKQQIAKEMIDKSIRVMYISDKRKKELSEEYSSTMSIILEELLKSENVRMIDITEIGSGTYSTAYQIGDKVLKVGTPRETYNMPNHPRILQPLTRTNLVDDKDNNRVFACIEISDRVDELDWDDIQEEKLYQLYKELRQDGIIWTDVRFPNVGKLRKQNIPSLNGETMYVAPQSVGLSHEVEDTKLNAGDFVILDTDYIYDEKDADIRWAARIFKRI